MFFQEPKELTHFLLRNGEVARQLKVVEEVATKLYRLDRCWLNDGYHSVILTTIEEVLDSIGFLAELDDEGKVSYKYNNNMYTFLQT